MRKRTTTSGLVSCVVLSLAGCAAQPKHAELRLHGERAVVLIEGQGKVDGEALDCSGDRDGCVADVDELSSARVSAQANPGWHFVGWRREVRSMVISPSFGGHDEVVYTALFAPEDDIAKADRR